MFDDKVVLHDAIERSFGTITEFVRVSIVCKVGMVRVNNYVVSKKEVSPVGQSSVYGG